MAEFALVLGLWTFALVVACAVADKSPSVLTFLGVLATMGFVLGYAWWFSHVMVDNGKWSAGKVAAFFVLLGLSYLLVPTGVKSGISVVTGILLRFLALVMRITLDAVKAAITFTTWTRVVLVTMGLIFLFVYAPHFYGYGD